jgi:hypothetical protein
MSHILIPAVTALSNAMFSKQNTHPGLRQQVIAVRIKNLSKEINELVNSYDKSLEQITLTRKTLTKSRKTSVAQIARLKAKLHAQERRLLSSQLPLKIAKLRAVMKQLNEQILDEE